jgi:hypothetical protein
LNQLPGFLLFKLKKDKEPVNIPAVHANRMSLLSSFVLEAHELIGLLGRASQIGCARESQRQQIQDQTVVLENEGGKLQTLEDSVRVCVVHVFVSQHYVVFSCHVVSDVVVNN